MIRNYEFLLNKIADRMESASDKKFLKKNTNEIAQNLYNFSDYLSNLMTLSSSNKSFKKKSKELQKMKFKDTALSKNESKKILNALQLKKIVGGGKEKQEIAVLKDIHNSVDKNTKFCISNFGLVATKILTNFPRYGVLMLSTFFSNLADVYNFDWHTLNDFTSKLDWVYLYLFAAASIPMVGFYIDIIIIFRAIKQGRIFLAVITYITNIMSMFVFHVVDMGLLIKILYFLDVLSYSSNKKAAERLTKGDPNVFLDSQDRDIELHTDEDTVTNIQNIFDKVQEKLANPEKQIETLNEEPTLEDRAASLGPTKSIQSRANNKKDTNSDIMSQTPSVDTYTQEPPLTEDFPPEPPLTEDFPPEPSLNEGIPPDPTLYIEDSSMRDIGSKINQNLSGMKKRISDKYSNMKIEIPKRRSQMSSLKPEQNVSPIQQRISQTKNNMTNLGSKMKGNMSNMKENVSGKFNNMKSRVRQNMSPVQSEGDMSPVQSERDMSPVQSEQDMSSMQQRIYNTKNKMTNLRSQMKDSISPLKGKVMNKISNKKNQFKDDSSIPNYKSNSVFKVPADNINAAKDLNIDNIPENIQLLLEKYKR